MKVLDRTWNTLWRLAAKSNRHDILLLYLYYYENGEKAPTQNEIKEATGLSLKNIKAGTSALEALKLISIEPLPRNKRKILTCNIFSLDVDASYSSIIDIYSYRYKRIESNRNVQTEKPNESSRIHLNWNIADIKADEDWKKAESILIKYFKPYQINPTYLTRKQYFSKLITLMDDVNFEKYCQWYRVNKYPLRKFNYGLFLFPGVIEEFKDTLEDSSDTYLNVTTRMETSNEYQEQLKEQESLLVQFKKGGNSAPKTRQ